MMKRTMLTVVSAALALGASSGLAQSPAGTDAPVALSGEVVDLHCYVTRGAEGPDHEGCGNACVSRGVSAGFLAEDGTLYALLGEKPLSVKETVAGLVGSPATARGRVVERGGLRALQLVSIERRHP